MTSGNSNSVSCIMATETPGRFYRSTGAKARGSDRRTGIRWQPKSGSGTARWLVHPSVKSLGRKLTGKRNRGSCPLAGRQRESAGEVAAGEGLDDLQAEAVAL